MQNLMHVALTRPPGRMKRKKSVISVGKDLAEVKIYTLRNRAGYESFQCCWYDFGKRQTRTFGVLGDAKLFAQQKSVALANGLPSINEATLRDVEVFRACESRIARFGTSIPTIVEEWIATKEALPEVSFAEIADFYRRHHKGIPRKTVAEIILLFLEAKKAAGVSAIYLKVARCQLKKFGEQFGPSQIADVSTVEIDQFLRRCPGGPVYKNNIRRIIVTLFTWSREQGYLEQDRKTVAERAMSFSVPDAAPAIWTPDEMRTLLSLCPPSLLPLVVIGGFAGIRSAEIARLEWQDILWDQGEHGLIEVKARKAKTKSRRLVPLQDNLRKWLEPFRQENGPVLPINNHSVRLNYLGEKAGFQWRQNALRHSYASYRLADVKSADQVALELGNSPKKLFKHYRELVMPEAAKEWFSIMPPANWNPKLPIARRKRRIVITK